MPYELPVEYDKLTAYHRRQVREQYVQEQNGLCFYCKSDLKQPPPKNILDKPIRLEYFPPFFLDHPIHLQHDHSTGLTEGAVHAYCNAVMWQYENR